MLKSLKRKKTVKRKKASNLQPCTDFVPFNAYTASMFLSPKANTSLRRKEQCNDELCPEVFILGM